METTIVMMKYLNIDENAPKMKILKEKFDKKEIQNLPKSIFEGRIITIQTSNEADKAIEYLMKQSILGIDTETRPSFKKGTSYKVALLQVSTHDTCFLFRLNMIGVNNSIKKLLEDCSIIKVGLSLKDDLHQLSKRCDFTPGNYIDIQHIAKEIGIADRSLQKLYANLFAKKISKNQQLSNWETSTLSDAQKIYAATDAWACIKIYEEMKRLIQTKDYTIEKAEQPEHPINVTNAYSI